MMTVRALKVILKDWPDKTPNGELTEVWIETGLMLSSQVTNHSSLGHHNNLLLESNAFENHEDE